MNAADLNHWAVLVLPIAYTLLGVFVTAWLTGKRDNRERQRAFRERQLRDFYSPLLGLREDIRAKSELRIKVSGAANTTWRRLCAEARDTASPEEHLRRLMVEKDAQFGGIIDYNNEQFANEIMPAYRRMIA